LWHEKSFVIIIDILQKSFEPDDVFTDNFFLGFCKAFVVDERCSVIVADFEIVLIIIDFYPVFKDFIEVCLKVIDDVNYFVEIIFVYIQNILDIEVEKEFCIDFYILDCVGFISQKREVNQ